MKKELEIKDVANFELENGLVFRMSKERRQLYVPLEMEENVMRMVHENYGHLGIDKCTNQIQKHYYFPNMREKLGKFIRNCLKCIFYSAAPLSNGMNLHSIEKKPEPWDTLHVDHFGPLEGVNSKHKHVFAVVDSFTKFIKLYATNTSAKEAFCALRKHFTDYSRPRRIISDKGTAFTATEFEAFCKENNVKHIRNSTSAPRANGQVERANRVLKAMLAKLTEPLNHADWKQKLSEVEFALNNTVHCTTKQTPSVLLFGVEQRGQVIDELTEYLHDMHSNKVKNLKEIRKQAEQSIQKSQLYNEKIFKKKHKPAIEFEVGDFVVIKNVDTTVGKNKKLIPKYRGPYVVRKNLGHDRYVITDVENYQVTQIPYNGIIDSSRMKKWLEPCHYDKQIGTEGNTDENYYTNYEYLDNEQCDVPEDDMQYTNYEFLEEQL
ncbi:MAG: hypothetical protein EOP45_16045 [Sphingobacteriaceae bacterium]|nr:MAG: hypothetical protein EOP45_16045 [Sphingobacteriaceae bacterium]